MHHGHHRLSRRALIGGAAGVTGTALGAGLLWPTIAAAAPNLAPRPTMASTFTVGDLDFHITFFGDGVDASSLTDFRGFVGVADVQGNGTATNPDGTHETLLFDTDMRFMTGDYVSQNGQVHSGTFGLI
jgi:hypothetical protein